MCKISNGGHLRPSLYFFFDFFLSFNSPPRNKKNTPPIHSTPAAHPHHHPSYHCLQLLVDCCVLQPNGGLLRPRTHPPIYFRCIFIWRPNQGKQPQQEQTHRPAPATDSWGAAAPWFGAMADVAMEIWGKATGSREAVAYLVFVCCVCVWFVSSCQIRWWKWWEMRNAHQLWWVRWMCLLQTDGSICELEDN